MSHVELSVSPPVPVSKRLRAAASCVSALVAFWLAVLFLPWSSLIVLALGLSLWMSWTPAFVGMSIAVCVWRMAHKGVFAINKSVWLDRLLADPYFRDRSSPATWISRLSICFLVMSFLLALVGSLVKNGAYHGTFDLARADATSPYVTSYFNQEDYKSSMATTNICRLRVEGFLAGSKAGRKLGRTPVTLLIDGREASSPDDCSASGGLVHQMLVYRGAPPLEVED